MKDFQSVSRVREERNDAAYKRGVKEGFSQGAWMVAGVLVAVYFLVSQGSGLTEWFRGIVG